MERKKGIQRDTEIGGKKKRRKGGRKKGGKEEGRKEGRDK